MEVFHYNNRFFRFIVPGLLFCQNYASSYTPNHSYTSCRSELKTTTYFKTNIRSKTNFTPIRKPLSPLQYRYHDENDSDTTMIKIKTRTGPAFKMDDTVQGPAATDQTKTARTTGVNFRLATAIALNQILLLGFGTVLTAVFTWFQTGDFSSFANIVDWNDFSITWERALQGFLGTLPMMAIGSAIEKSDNRAFATTNLSTIIMVMTLLGRRKLPPDLPPDMKAKYAKAVTPTSLALVVSAFVSSLTGFCEEFVFRGEALATFSTQFSGNLPNALLAQAALFGLGHISPGTSLLENSIVMSLQAINGTWLGLLFFLSGGDIIPCIIAHALYDFQVFFGTWINANDQIEYAETMSLEPFSPSIEEEVRNIRTQLGPRFDDTMYYACKRLFFIFDFDKNGFISLNEARRGLSYLFLDKPGQPSKQDIDNLYAACIASRKTMDDVEKLDNDKLRFPDFLRFFLTIQAPLQAI